MLSLRDKLKAVSGPAKKTEQKAAPQDCMVRQERFPLSQFSTPPLPESARSIAKAPKWRKLKFKKI